MFVSFVLSPLLAEECFERLEVAPPTDVGELGRLVDQMGRLFPRGSTAKLEALADSRVPPGADPRWVAEMWLERPALAWSCWPACTLLAALVNSAGVLRADVLATRRLNPRRIPVDFHSSVEITDGVGRWLVDPYFHVAPVRAPGGDASRPAHWAEALVDPGSEGDGLELEDEDPVWQRPVWRLTVGSPSFSHVLRYRSFTGGLSSGDVDAFCRISVTYSGMPSRPIAELATADGLLQAMEGRDGVLRLRRWRASQHDSAWAAVCYTEELPRWADAEEAILVEAQTARKCLPT